MSSWERARNIPWDRIPQDGSDLDGQKERIFRQLQRETIEDELRQQERRQELTDAVSTSSNGTTSGVEGLGELDQQGNTTTFQKKQIIQPRFPYSNMELLRQAAFGGCIGTITGGVFGFLDGMRAAGESSVLKNASDVAKFRLILKGTTHNATLFGVYFGGFHILKYGLRVGSNDQLGPYYEILLAAPAALGALSYKPTWRPALPYGVMLIGMDIVHNFMRRN